MFSGFDGGGDVDDVAAATGRRMARGEGIEDPDGPADGGQRSVFMDVYAALAKFHMKAFGTTQAQLAAVAAKNHDHSQHNPLSQYRAPMSVEEVLAARRISWPLKIGRASCRERVCQYV